MLRWDFPRAGPGLLLPFYSFLTPGTGPEHTAATPQDSQIKPNGNPVWIPVQKKPEIACERENAGREGTGQEEKGEKPYLSLVGGEEQAFRCFKLGGTSSL